MTAQMGSLGFLESVRPRPPALPPPAYLALVPKAAARRPPAPSPPDATDRNDVDADADELLNRMLADLAAQQAADEADTPLMPPQKPPPGWMKPHANMLLRLQALEDHVYVYGHGGQLPADAAEIPDEPYADSGVAEESAKRIDKSIGVVEQQVREFTEQTERRTRAKRAPSESSAYSSDSSSSGTYLLQCF